MGEISDCVKQVLNPLVDRGFITEKNLKYLVLPKPRLGRFYLLPIRFINVLKMFRVDQLFQIAVQLRKEFQNFWIV
jgi:hypothetical protein